jgi:hypothetical protein
MSSGDSSKLSVERSETSHFELYTIEEFPVESTNLKMGLLGLQKPGFSDY